MVEDGVLKADRSKASNPSELEQVKEHQKVPTPPKVLMPRQVPWPQQILRPQLPQQNILRPQLAPRLAQQGLRSQPLGRRIRVMLPQNVTEEKQVHTLQSKRQLFNQNDMPTYSNKKVAVEHNIQSTSGIFPVSQPKQVFKCKICVKYFIKQEVCLHHIQEHHDKPASIIMETKPCNPVHRINTPQPKFQLNKEKPESSTDDKKEVTEEKEDAAEPQ